MGSTFSEYLLQMWIAEACGLLIESSLPVAEIAIDCGFESQGYFNRSFKRIKNCTPVAFRKRS